MVGNEPTLLSLLPWEFVPCRPLLLSLIAFPHFFPPSQKPAPTSTEMTRFLVSIVTPFVVL